jgi:uncharacterized RDD family membrane protein YckC
VTQPVAGWYPDPAGSGGRRYWNGSAWTDHVASPPGVEPAPEVEPATPADDARDAPVTPTPPAPAPVPSAPPPLAPPYQQVPYSGPAGPGPAWGTPAPPPMVPVGVAILAKLGPDGQVLSGWWRRFFGYFIDGLLISIVTFLFIFVVASVTGGFDRLVDLSAWQDWIDKVEANPNYQPTNAEMQQLLAGVLPLIGWITLGSLVLSFANGVILVNRSGQTIGDRMVGNRKVVAGRTPPAFGASFVRWIIPGVLSLLSWIVPLVGQVPWILDYLWPLWDKQKQTWHDKAASTYVENSNMAGPLNR